MQMCFLGPMEGFTRVTDEENARDKKACAKSYENCMAFGRNLLILLFSVCAEDTRSS